MLDDDDPAAARIREVCRYIEAHPDDTHSLDELAARAALSRFHFARRFKAIVGVTPKQYSASVRLRTFKRELRARKPVLTALHDAGYGSSSGLYEQAGTRLGMTPAQYREAGRGVEISYAFADTSLGLMLIGATDRGLCFVQFGETRETLLDQLRSEYAKAAITPMPRPYRKEFAAWIDALRAHLDGTRPDAGLPVDICATAFQLRVWSYLQSIPYGEVRSYREVAEGIGAPRSARAVARACASNVVAIVIPCHRVIRGTGELGGYRWGLARKRTLIDGERARRV